MTMDLRTRRRVGGLIRLGLIAATFVFIGAWFWRRAPRPPEHVAIQRAAPPATALSPGDLQIVSTDGSIDLILQGDKIMGGLSPAMVQKVKDKMAKDRAKDSSGLGGMIGGIVKSAVAEAIGAHVTYPLSEVQELRFDDGKLVIRTRSGGDKEHSFGDIKVDDRKEPARFSKEDGDRFVAAVQARKKELDLP